MRILNIFLILLATIAALIVMPNLSFSREILLFSFEKDPQGWEVPDWAIGKKDHVVQEIGISEFQASAGKYALEASVDFPNEPGWKGAYVERVVDVTDWSPFKYLTADVFLPKEAPRGLRARIILTVGDEWKWTEMNKSIMLTPGEWTVLKVDLSADSLNWKSFITDSFRSDVKKIGIRVESNGNVQYKGPIYIDNIRLSD
jgi:hypothetical protein